MADRNSTIRRAYTLIEMLTTVAALIIVLGLMISLARHVRVDSAHRVTNALLVEMDHLMAQYIALNDGRLPEVRRFIDADTDLDETHLRRTARLNNEAVVRLLRRHHPDAGELFQELPLSIYDVTTLRDAWGSPIVFMHRQHPAIGMAPADRSFFFSAGPDRRYLTRADNLYSYEAPGAGPGAYETRRDATGHPE